MGLVVQQLDWNDIKFLLRIFGFCSYIRAVVIAVFDFQHAFVEGRWIFDVRFVAIMCLKDRLRSGRAG